MRIPLLVLVALSILPLNAVAQDPGAPPALYLSGTDIMAELDRAAAASASAGGWSISISPGISVRRRSSTVQQYAVVHPYSVEIYRILEGSGTLVTGGILRLPLEERTSDDLFRTQHGVDGGLARQVSAGDVLVLQPGTPHWFSSIDGDTITYMESRIRITTHPVQYQQ